MFKNKKFDRIKKFYKENALTYGLGMFWLILVDTLQMVQPRVLGYIIDSFQLGTMTSPRLIRFAMIIFAIGLLSAVARFFWRFYISGNSNRLDYSLRKDYFNHLLNLSPRFYNANRTGDLMSIGINDIGIVRRSLGLSLLMFIDALYIIIAAVVMMVATTNLRLTLIAGINFPFIYLLTRFFNNIVYTRSQKTQEAFANLTDITRETYSGIRVIKAFNQEEKSYDNYKNVNQDNFDKNMDLIKADGLFNPSIRFLYSISVLITILFGGRQVISGAISIGEFIAFNSYLAVLQSPLRFIGQILNNIQRGFAALDRIENIFDEEIDIKEIDQPKDVKMSSALKFNSVNFTYPNSQSKVLKDISFDLEGGKTLAIIGATGSGKTTIVDLILRLYDIDSGQITIDGVDIKDMDLDILRENIAYVPQDNFLFSGTIKENIGFSYDYNEDIPDQGVIDAASQADLKETLDNFSNGINTVLGERGISLSGGQKQRTNMARAFIKDARILILDDSLSAVDTKTEENILNNISKMDYEIGKIIISHRISSIKDADEILVVDDGQIVQRGDHAQLAQEDGIYKIIYEEQQSEEGASNEK